MKRSDYLELRAILLFIAALLAKENIPLFLTLLVGSFVSILQSCVAAYRESLSDREQE